MKCLGIALLTLLTTTSAVFAQSTGMPQEAQQCVACHGAHGEGNPASGGPRIAGQSEYYLRKQLDSYVEGTRRNPIMEPIAKALSTRQRQAASAYFAGLDPPRSASQVAAGQATSKRALQLVQRGDEGRHVQACANCHGPQGRGEPPLSPYLAGLDAAYLTAAINAWKNGARNNDAGKQMATVAASLQSDDIAALAAYFASLPAPPPSMARIVAPGAAQPQGTAPATREPAGPSPAGPAGVEQGAPTRGGTQGPGGSGESKTGK